MEYSSGSASAACSDWCKSIDFAPDLFPSPPSGRADKAPRQMAGLSAAAQAKWHLAGQFKIFGFQPIEEIHLTVEFIHGRTHQPVGHCARTFSRSILSRD